MNKQAITEQLSKVIWDSENALRLFNDPFFMENSARLKENIAQAARAFSGSWIGYHANVYYCDLRTPPPGDRFSSEFGLMEGYISNPMSGNWIEYPSDAIRKALLQGVDAEYLLQLEKISTQAQKVLDESYDIVRMVLDVLQSNAKAPALGRVHEELDKLLLKLPVHGIIDVLRPKGTYVSRDAAAMSQRIRTPPHLILQAEEASRIHTFKALESLTGFAYRIFRYMEINALIERKSMPAGQKVFIGHGRSSIWRELKDFFHDRLHLQWDEFNREPPAGIPTTERLQQMLDSASIAFLVMTAEDQHADQTLHARENVIHEVGLFQGRLGFRRAIILLEEGCKEFSNISGLTRIHFPPNNISACFEEVRRVLEREGIQ